MKKRGKCVHYNGAINRCCEAGVSYSALSGGGDDWARRLPCIGPEYRTGHGQPLPRADAVVACDKRREPTDEEIAADETAASECMDRIVRIRAAVVAHLGGPWKKGTPGASGSVPCPCCGGTVRFSRSGYNGHVHAACSTPDCASWME